MTPLYAATQASQSASLAHGDQTVGGGAEGGVLRATQQALAFTPTQGMDLFGLPLIRLSLVDFPPKNLPYTEGFHGCFMKR